MAQSASPASRSSHESALIGDELHLFGGKGTPPYDCYYFPRNEIWTCNVREERKWILRIAQGKNIPPPCQGARCVVINGIIYSYGGEKVDGGYLEEVFGLDPKKMKWIQVAVHIHGKKPWQRSSCCLWAIGERMIMFGGRSAYIPHYRLQSRAQCDRGVNNEIYAFAFEEGREYGYWLDVELSGKRPKPRACAAMETIDQHRGLRHGGEDGHINSLDDAFVIDLREKKWICIDFLPKPFARQYHRICRLSKEGFKEINCFLLIGGWNYRSEFSNHAYILDFDKRKSYAFSLNPGMAAIGHHTLHCVENRDGSARITVTGGEDRYRWFRELNEILKEFTLGPSNESYTQIETLMEVEKLRDERTQSHQVIEEQRRQFEQEKMQRSGLETRCNSLQREINVLRIRCRDLEREKTDVTHALEAQTTLAESKNNLYQLMDVLSIHPAQARLTNEKVGSGAYADVIIGHWHGTPVAIKRFHALITTPRTIPKFQREVLTASRLHHPNIIRVCGAVMEDGIPFQIVSELLEGSVSEVLDAAHSSPRYLSQYEPLSIVRMTSAIAYLHGLKPRPYVHADIRPTNVLVTRDMKVKVADLGA